MSYKEHQKLMYQVHHLDNMQKTYGWVAFHCMMLLVWMFIGEAVRCYWL